MTHQLEKRVRNPQPTYRLTECSTRWTDTTPLSNAKWCAKGNHFLFDPSNLNQDQLISLICFHEGKPPRTLYKRPDGMVMTKKCSVNREKIRLSLIYTISSVAVVLAIYVQFVNHKHRTNTCNSKHIVAESHATLPNRQSVSNLTQATQTVVVGRNTTVPSPMPIKQALVGSSAQSDPLAYWQKQ